MTHGSLFSGIGGFDLAAEWMGWDNKFHCEWNPFGQKILNYYWPNATSYDDITKTDFNVWRDKIDILTGGFPCQPYSQAGKRKGTEDDRHLWPEMLRAIREIRPRWVVGENVSGLLNWSKGMVLDEIKADLEAAGFEVFPPLVLPACSVNAPHRRDRVWIVAHSKVNGLEGHRGHRKVGGIKRNQRSVCVNERDSEQTINNSIGIRRTSDDIHTGPVTKGEKGWEHGTASSASNWTAWPTQPPICIGNDGLPAELAGFTISEWKQESIKSMGNSVVPQLVHQIFKTIEQYENAIQKP